MKNIFVSDITLKVVNEQDLSLMFREKLAVAELIDASGVNAIELPALTNSKENEIIYRTISSTIKNAMVKIPVGDSKESLEKAIECVKGAKSVCLQVVMPLSTTQMEYFHHLKAPAMQAKIVELVSLAKGNGYQVEFVAKDAFRAEQGFVESLAKSVFDAGAFAITLCDDAGQSFPEDYKAIIENIKAVCDIEVYVQPSNALSLASACAVESIKAGANGVKTSAIGNYLSTEIISKVLNAKKYQLNVDCCVDVTNVNTIVSKINGISKVEDIVEEKVVLGKFNADATASQIASAIKQLGYELSDADVGKVFDEFKKLATQKGAIDAKELEAVIASNAMQVPSTFHLVNYVVNSSNVIPATANVTLEKDGEKFTGVSTGDGPIDAAFHAIEQIIGHHYELDDFQVHAVTKGREAVGSSIIRLRADGKLYPGNGASTDIVGACIRAYINALNKIVYKGN